VAAKLYKRYISHERHWLWTLGIGMGLGLDWALGWRLIMGEVFIGEVDCVALVNFNFNLDATLP